ncbi:MAG: DNA-processing protein DprA [Acidobacteriota bacterium]|nr:DNA-processing protein DprA [Acidobacteriota bacterium]
MWEWIALNMTPGVGPRAATKLLERFGSPASVFGARRVELEGLRLRPETIESIIKNEFREKAAEEIEKIRELRADVLVLDDGVYPSLVREIADPPIVLYVRGDWMNCFDAPCVGFVGSRRASTYGQNAAEMLARDLASRGVCIVSGLARGIDAAAHRAAIEAGGRTIAVLGTGISDVYPKEHKKLVEQILETGGALVTQFPLETPPLPENFPYRNRVISGLSLGVVIVEATERSGSLITARLAIEQNREVFAVPGNITSRNSVGTNYLIKSAGAKLVQSWQDIASELPKEIAARLLPPETAKTASNKAQIDKIPLDLSEEESVIWNLLSADEATNIDDLQTESQLSFGDLSAALLGLEMRDLIRVLPGRCYARKI